MCHVMGSAAPEPLEVRNSRLGVSGCVHGCVPPPMLCDGWSCVCGISTG